MTKQKAQGLLIVFEGTDGTGKSTQLQLLHDYLHERGFPVTSTREPTKGKYGQKIRQLYVDRSQCTHEEELELFLADRREHVRELLAPSLDDGRIILCDRYFLSTAAYQGAIGFDLEKILELNKFAPDPDIALLFQVPLEVGLERITSGRGESLNDFEQKENLAKVGAIFDSIKRSYIKKIDASGSIEEVHRQVIAQVTPLLSRFTSTTQD